MDKYRYRVNDYGKIELLKYLFCEDSDVVIPEQIDGKPVTGIGPGCFFAHKEIESVSFPVTLTAIGDSAFALCAGLRELVLPDGVSDIGKYAFRDCTGLKKIILPKALKRLRAGTFSFCYLPDDAEIILNEGLEIIEPNVFSGGGIRSGVTLTVPDSVRSIAPGAFVYGMKLITSLPYDESWFE